MALVTLEEAKRQLRITWDDENENVEFLMAAAEDAVLDYIKRDYEWDENTVPARVKLSILVMVSEYYDSYRDGGEYDNNTVAFGYLTPPITALLHRLRKPAYA